MDVVLDENCVVANIFLSVVSVLLVFGENLDVVLDEICAVATIFLSVVLV